MFFDGLQKSEEPAVYEHVTVKVVDLNEVDVQLLLTDGKMLRCNTALFMASLGINEEADVEHLTEEGPVAVQVTKSGEEVLSTARV